MDEIDKFRTPERQILEAPVPPPPPPPPPPSPQRVISLGLSEYFTAASERMDYLEYGDPSDYLFRRTGKEFPRSPLNKIWVPATFRGQDDAGADIYIDQIIKDKSHTVLLLAEAGIGKSTLARYLTCRLNQEYLDRKSDQFALYVPLKAMRFSKGGKNLSYSEVIVDCAMMFVGLDKQESAVQIESELEKAILIFDGLDELPSSKGNPDDFDQTANLRNEALQLIRLASARSIHQTQLIPFRSFVTSRFRDYTDDKTLHLRNAPIYNMAKFSPNQVGEAIRKWHDAAATVLKNSEYKDRLKNELESRPEAIVGALKENSDLGQVCLTPLMLSILQTVHSGSQDLPSSVGQLCERAINWLMVAKHSNSRDAEFIRKNENWLLRTLSQLGWDMQDKYVNGAGGSVDDDTMRIIAKSTRAELLGIAENFEYREDQITKLCAHIRRGHGIIVPLTSGKFEFSHNVFREVMAGQALGRLPTPERFPYALNIAWHGPLRYWAGLIAATDPGLNEISALCGELEQAADSGELLAILAQAEMLAEVCAVSSWPKLIRDLKRRIERARLSLISVIGSGDVSFANRLRIGDLLALLGDTRIDLPVVDRLCAVAGADVIIGRATNHATRLPKYSSCPSSPQISGKINAFKIGSYLITNKEYGEFIHSNGYNTERFWPTDISRGWARGDRATQDDLIQRAESDAKKHFSSEIAGNRLDPDALPDRCKKMIERRLPMYWYDPALNRPNQPVVGVNFWEAHAYCRWLTECLRGKGLLAPHELVRLPTEVEWESAARLCGDGSRYPWNTGAPFENAHVRIPDNAGNEIRALRSCAVGLFKFVDSNQPIYDLVGNVWEITGSKAQPYTELAFEQLVDPQGLEDRVARGSSWLSSEIESTEITFRSFDPPYNAYEDLGFRIVVYEAKDSLS